MFLYFHSFIVFHYGLIIDGPDTTAALPVPAVAADGAGGDTFTYTDGTQAWTSHPNTHGQCNSDYFTIGSSGTSPPVICGENAGQHSKFFLINSALWI